MKQKYLSPVAAGCICAFIVLSLLWIVAGWSPEPGYMKQTQGSVRGIWSDPAHGLPRFWSGSLTASSVLLTVVYMFGASFLGSTLFIRSVLLSGTARMSATALLAGFIPGYLLLAPCNRLISLLITNRSAAFLELALLAGFCGWRLYSGARALQGQSNQAFDNNRTWGKSVVAYWPFLALILTLIWGVCSITGDATGFTFISIFGDPQRFPAPLAKLPLFGQHYDEICFLHPVLFSGLFTQDSDLLTPYWLMTGFARISVLLLSYICTRRLGLRGFEALVVAAFVFLSSQSINPGADWEFLDNGHPMIMTAHPARLIAAVAPLIFAVLYSRNRQTSDRWPSFSTLCVASVLGAGMAAISFHVFATLLLLTGFCVLFISPRGTREAQGHPAYMAVAPCLLLLLPLPYVRSIWAGQHHVLFGVILIAFAAYVAFRNQFLTRLKICLGGPGWKTRLALTVSVLGGAGLGVLFLGNLLAPKFGFYKIFGVDLLVRGVPPGTFSPGLINTNLPVPPGANVLWNASSAPHFIAALGLPVLLAAFVFLLHSLLRPAARLQNLLLSLVECMLTGFLCGVGLYHFMGKNVDFWLSIWVRCRLAEGWFYGLNAIALCSLFALLPAKGRRALCYCVLFWAVLPWSGLADKILAKQFVYNLRWLTNQAAK